MDYVVFPFYDFCCVVAGVVDDLSQRYSGRQLLTWWLGLCAPCGLAVFLGIHVSMVVGHHTLVDVERRGREGGRVDHVSIFIYFCCVLRRCPRRTGMTTMVLARCGCRSTWARYRKGQRRRRKKLEWGNSVMKQYAFRCGSLPNQFFIEDQGLSSRENCVFA